MSTYNTKITKKFPTNKEEEKTDNVVACKLNINSVFNKEEYTPSKKSPDNASSGKSDKEFLALLNEPIIDLDKLKKLAWHGIPRQFRAKTWKLLLKYLPQNKSTQESSVKRKRDEYFEFVTRHVDNIEESHLEEAEKAVRKIIWADVLRTQPDIKLYHIDIVQKTLNNILCVWHCRNPASGYVQGINDIAAAFFVAFLNDYISGIDPYTFEVPDSFVEQLESNKNILKEVEADTYWCLTKIVEPIIENYTKEKPLVTKSLKKIEEVIQRVDNSLHEHFVKEEVLFMQFAFRWLFCLLLREFPLNLGLRLFDTYISDDEGLVSLHIFVCAAILLKWTKTLKKMNFNEIIPFLQNLPTKDWNEDDISMLLSESYVFQSMFSKK